MKNLRIILLYAVALSMIGGFAVFTGCSNQEPQTINGYETGNTDPTITPAPGDEDYDQYDGVSVTWESLGLGNEATIESHSTLATPSIECVASTDSTIRIRICAGATGMPGGFLLQFADLPAGVACGSFAWSSAGVHSFIFSSSTFRLAPNACIELTVRGLECEETLVFRVRAQATTLYNCSAFTANLCCSTGDCDDEENPPECLDEPTIECVAATDSSLTIEVCAGPSGAPAGFVLQRAVLPDAANCASFVWPSTGVSTTYYISTTYQLDPNECVTLTIRNLACEEDYVFRARALICVPFDCPSNWSANVCCPTADCPDQQEPCLDEPTVVCVDATDSSLTVQVTAGPSGAPTGITLQRALLPQGTSCGAFVWPASGFQTVQVGPLEPNAFTTVTFNNLECETAYAFRAMANLCVPFCPSDWSPIVCCVTDDCPDQTPECPDEPVVTCVSETDSSLTVRICAGPSGAAAGVRVEFAELAAGTVCANASFTNAAYVTTGALSPNQCIEITIDDLECETAYAFRAQTLICAPFECPSDWSAIVCCVTDECPDQTPDCPEEPVVTCVAETDSSLTVRICAGADGAAAGVFVQYAAVPAGTACASFVFPSSPAHFTTGALAPNQCIEVTIDDLECETAYAFRAQVIICPPFNCPSDWSSQVCCVTDECEDDQGPGDGCVLTQGYWKNHEEDWPVTSLTLGGITYTQEQLLGVLNTPTRGNAVIILAKQLIAAELNIAAGADNSCIALVLSGAHSLLSSNNLNITTSNVHTSTPLGAQLAGTGGVLDQYNNGYLSCAEHCED